MAIFHRLSSRYQQPVHFSNSPSRVAVASRESNSKADTPANCAAFLVVRHISHIFQRSDANAVKPELPERPESSILARLRESRCERRSLPPLVETEIAQNAPGSSPRDAKLLPLNRVGETDEWHVDLRTSFEDCEFRLSSGDCESAVESNSSFFESRFEAIRSIGDSMKCDGVQ